MSADGAAGSPYPESPTAASAAAAWPSTGDSPYPDAARSSAEDVDVVLPCLNEASALPWVLTRMPPGYHPIVVDNASTDGSADVARAHGARVVDAPVRGFGAAVHAGVMAAVSPTVAIMDADASLDPGDLPALVRALRSGDVDIVLGRRMPEGRGAWPLHARLGNAFLARTIRRRTGWEVRDLGPMRVARTTALQDLPIRDRRFGYPLEMVLRAAESGWRVRELPVPYRPRDGRSKVTGTVRGTFRTIKDMRRVLES